MFFFSAPSPKKGPFAPAPKGVSQELSLGDVDAVAERHFFFKIRFYAIMVFFKDAFLCDFFFFFANLDFLAIKFYIDKK